MKSISNYIQERLTTNKDIVMSDLIDWTHYRRYPKSRVYNIYDEKDWNKMKAYKAKGSKPERLVSSIKTDDKLIHRWQVAYIMGWGAAILEFEHALIERRIFNKDTLDREKDDLKNPVENITILSDTNDNVKSLFSPLHFVFSVIYNKYYSNKEIDDLQLCKAFYCPVTELGQEKQNDDLDDVKEIWNGFVFRVSKNGVKQDLLIDFNSITGKYLINDNDTIYTEFQCINKITEFMNKFVADNA